MNLSKAEFMAGSRAVAPVLVGTIPFGFVAGVAAISALQFELPGPLERGSDAAKAGASAAFNALST